MIRDISIQNYKSIQQLDLSLGRVTVLIGANGSGKSNILEAIALSSAAANDKLDNEFLASRGTRATDDPRFMRAAFQKENVQRDIAVHIRSETDAESEYVLQNLNDQPYSSWTNRNEGYIRLVASQKHIGEPLELPKNWAEVFEDTISKNLLDFWAKKFVGPEELRGFLIYSPDYSQLRTSESEGQIQPLGIRGEGLFKLLKVLSLDKNQHKLQEIKDKLTLIDWFSDFEVPYFEVPSDLAPWERNLRIKDRYLHDDLSYFNQKSASEGFLFLVFYFCLFISDDTPSFFAIDNIDASLNPKLCSRLMEELVGLAAAHDKQVILTTHNPAVLDGLNLRDDEQRLFVVSRNRRGHTRVERICPPQVAAGQTPVRLSEAFLRGYIGGLSEGF